MEVVESIRHMATEVFLETPLAQGKPTLAQVIATVLPWTKQQVTLLEAYTNHKGTMVNFGPICVNIRIFRRVEKSRNCSSSSNLAHSLKTTFHSWWNTEQIPIYKRNGKVRQ